MNDRLLFDFQIIQIDWIHLLNSEEDRYKKLIFNLIRSELPFKITNSQVYSFNNSYEDVKKLIRSEVISINASLDQTYSGISDKHSQIEMSHDIYFSTSEKSKNSEQSGNLENNDFPQLSLYLSQYNLLEKWNKKELCNVIRFELLEKLTNDIFTRINIWHSFNNTLSNFHYDSYDNFLLVAKGLKRVILLPNNTKFILPCNNGENSSNQCKQIRYRKLTPQLKLLKDKLSQFRFDINNYSLDFVNLVEDYKSYIKTMTKYFFPLVEIKVGEILYIPEAWWHQVSTEVSQFETSQSQLNNITKQHSQSENKMDYCNNESFAINFWWEKTNRLINNGKEIFLIKRSIESLLEKKIKREYFKVRKFYRKYTIAYLKRLFTKENCREVLINNLFTKSDDNSWIVIYSEFERHHSDKEFFSLFWSTLNQNTKEDYSIIFLKKIDEMKRRLTTDVIKYIHNIYKDD
jgi:hypothetical protein